MCQQSIEFHGNEGIIFEQKVPEQRQEQEKERSNYFETKMRRSFLLAEKIKDVTVSGSRYKDNRTL